MCFRWPTIIPNQRTFFVDVRPKLRIIFSEVIRAMTHTADVAYTLLSCEGRVKESMTRVDVKLKINKK